MNDSAPNSRTDTTSFVASGCEGATINASSSLIAGTDAIAWSVGLNETTPISTPRPNTSEAIRLARLRFTSTLMSGCRARKTASTGSRYITVYSFALRASFPCCKSFNSLIARCAPCRKLSICSAKSNNTRPAAVSVPSFDERSNSGSPSSTSSRRIA